MRATPTLRVIAGGKRKPQTIVRVESAAAVLRAIYWQPVTDRPSHLRLLARE